MRGREGGPRTTVRYGVEKATHRGHAAVVLRRGGDGGDTRAVFLPQLGMLCASLSQDGEELLGRTDELENYAVKGSTVGIPFLHPWANRLADLRYRAAGRAVELDPGSPLLHFDANRLPLHGVPGARLPWLPTAEQVGADAACLEARLEWSAPALLALFPFPHRLEVAARLGFDGLTLTTDLVPSAEAAVPISFGYHPYLRLPGAPRSEWRLSCPRMRRLELDARGIPTGSESGLGWQGDRLADAVLDDAFAGLTDGARFVLEAAGRRLALRFVQGYRYAQLYAPRGSEFIAIEPMTAPANALASGRGLRLVSPGASFRAAFCIEV